MDISLIQQSSHILAYFCSELEAYASICFFSSFLRENKQKAALKTRNQIKLPAYLRG